MRGLRNPPAPIKNRQRRDTLAVFCLQEMVRRKGEACSRNRERASPLLYSNYSSNYSIGSDLVAGEPGNAVKALLQVGIGGDVVAHLAIMELLVGHHVKVAGAGQAKDDGLFLAGLLALEGLVDGGADGVAALGGRQDALSLVWLDFITSLS